MRSALVLQLSVMLAVQSGHTSDVRRVALGSDNTEDSAGRRFWALLAHPLLPPEYWAYVSAMFGSIHTCESQFGQCACRLSYHQQTNLCRRRRAGRTHTALRA